MLIKGNPSLPAGIRNLLLIQLGDIGDVVLTTPAIQALREAFPSARIHAAVREKARGILECCPPVDDISYVKKEGHSLFEAFRTQRRFFRRLRRPPLDLSIDLRTGTRGAIMALLSGAPTRIGRYSETDTLWRNRVFTHLVAPREEATQYCAEHGLNILRPFGIATQERRPKLVAPPTLHDRAASILASAGLPRGRPFIAVQPFSLWEYKEWPAECFARLISLMSTEFERPVVLIGTRSERERAAGLAAKARGDIFHLAGMTTLDELAGVLSLATMLIGCDSAGIHIAAAVGTPTVSIFGPSSPISWAPRGPRHHVVCQHWDCVPCRQKGCQNSEVSRCLQTLPVEAVLETVRLAFTDRSGQ